MAPEHAQRLLEGWLLTVWMHAGVLVGALWLARSLVRRLPLGVQESLWRTALLGGFLTAALSVAWSGRTAGPRVHLPSPATSLAEARAVPSAPRPSWSATAPPPSSTAPGGPVLSAPLPRVDASREGTAGPLPGAARPAGFPWPLLERFVLALLGFGALLALLRGVVARRRLRAHLAGRRPVPAGSRSEALARLLEGTRLAGGVRLTEAPRLASPVAIGVRRPEICVPSRALAELDPPEWEALLAHEVAHHLRRDPVWLLLAGLVEDALLLQPLLRVATRALRRVAEVRADAWAGERTGDPATLARCLTRVARWMLARPRALGAPAMARAGSALTERVERLLASDGERPRSSSKAWALASLVALLFATAWLAPRADATAAAVEPGGGPSRPAVDTDAAWADLDRSLDLLDAEVADLATLIKRLPETDGLSGAAGALEARLERLKARRVRLGPAHDGTPTDGPPRDSGEGAVGRER